MSNLGKAQACLRYLETSGHPWTKMGSRYSEVVVARNGVLPRRFGSRAAVSEEHERDQTVTSHVVADDGRSLLPDSAADCRPSLVAAAAG